MPPSINVTVKSPLPLDSCSLKPSAVVTAVKAGVKTVKNAPIPELVTLWSSAPTDPDSDPTAKMSRTARFFLLCVHTVPVSTHSEASDVPAITDTNPAAPNRCAWVSSSVEDD